jgi:hypothetical protein
MSVNRQKLAMVLSVVFCLLACCPNSLCQKKKIQVFVKHEGDDTVGDQLTFAIRESLRRSEGYALGDDGADTIMELVSAQTAPGVSVVSVVIIKKGHSAFCSFNLVHLVYSIGSLRIKDIADDIVATLDKQVTEFNFLYTEH